jgi:predicted permease
MDGIRRDVRQALRGLLRNKGFAVAALVSLALGIGANTALFSVVYGVLLRPLPYPEADRLVRLSEHHPGAVAMIRAPLLSDLTFNAWREAPRALEGLAAYSPGAFIETGGDEPVRLAGAVVSPELFPLLRIRPAAGRLLLPEDAVEGGAPVAVIGDALWQRRFGGERSAVGKALVLDGIPHTIVGVTPPGFYFPDRDALLWTPYQVTSAGEGSVNVFGAIGRLVPATTAAQAATEGTAAARGVTRPPVTELLFGTGGPVEVRVRRLGEEEVAAIRSALLVLAAGAGFILLICCANVSNLLLSRGVARRRELAVRAAMGAGRVRIARQMITESLVLAILGGALGIALAALLLELLPALAPADFPRLADVRLDGGALAFATLVAATAGVVSGLVPALRAARGTLLPALREGTGASAPGAPAKRLGGGLLVAEAALAVVLLVGAGLLMRSFERLAAVDAGYDPGNVLLARVYLGGEPPPERTRALAEALGERLATIPGVEAAGAGNMAPLAPWTAISRFDLPNAGPDGETVTAQAVTYVVTPGYAEALSLRLVEGRLLSAADLDSGTRALVVNESFARAYLGGEAIGRRFELVHGTETGITEIVGVVGDVLKDGMDAEPQSAIYTLPEYGYSLPPSELSVVMRTAGDPLALAPQVRALAGELEPAAAVEVATLASRRSASLAQPRFAAAALSTFALLALLLAATGLYGVLSYNVSQRRREIGVRSALGARPAAIVGLVLRQVLAVTAAGLALGLAGSAALTRLLESLLFGVTPLDAVAFGAAPVLLLAVALVACLVPARRAAAVDPTEALRSE